MNKMKKKLYIGCALTNLPEDKKAEFLQLIESIKKELKKDFEILEFWSATHEWSVGTPQDIYKYDIRDCVMKTDCMLSICDYPSLGLGYEIATAVEKMGIPVLAVAHKDSTVTRLIRGIDHKNFNFFYYNSADEIIAKAIETLTI